MRGEVIRGKEGQAASILCAGTKLVDELEAADSHVWDDKAALRKAIELRTELFGEDDVRVAEPLHALADSAGSADNP